MGAPIWTTAMVTGHRPQHLEPDHIDWIHDELLRICAKLKAEHGTTLAISGMALGTDLIWANAAKMTGLDLWAHVPFMQQPDVWRDPELQRQWRRLLDYAESCRKPVVVGDLGDLVDPERKRLATRLLHDRNTSMINATVLAGGVTVAVLRSSRTEGGTWSAYQKIAGRVPIIRVDPDRRTVTMAAAVKQTTTGYEQETLIP